MSDRQDTIEKLVVLDQFGPATRRCAGGRIVAVGWSCPHCDSRDPSERCEKPRRANAA